MIMRLLYGKLAMQVPSAKAMRGRHWQAMERLCCFLRLMALLLMCQAKPKLISLITKMEQNNVEMQLEPQLAKLQTSCASHPLIFPFPPSASHEFHETCHSVTFYFMNKDSKRCGDTTTPESIHTKDESKRGSAFAFIFGVN